MTIIAVNQTWADEGISEDPDGRVELTLGYQFISDVAISSTIALMGDLRFPFYGQQHPENANLVVVRRRINRISESRTVAEGEVTFSTRVNAPNKTGDSGRDGPQGNDGGVGDDPLQDDPVIEWIPIENTKVATVGRLRDEDTGNFSSNFTPITNSADRPYFDPPVEIRASEWQVLYRRNENNISQDILAYLNVVNEDDFTLGGVAIGKWQAFMPGARITSTGFRGGKFFVTVTYDIRLRPAYTRTGEINGFRGWELELQDRGFEYLDGSGDLVRAQNDDGTYAIEPVFLDGSGGKAATPGASPPRVYQCYIEKPFSIFNFQ